jgi:hypothetical protein
MPDDDLDEVLEDPEELAAFLAFLEDLEHDEDWLADEPED